MLAAVRRLVAAWATVGLRRTHWISLIGADPGMAEVLASVPDETAVPLREMGHSAGHESTEMAETAGWFR